MEQKTFTCYSCKNINNYGSLFCSNCHIIQPITEKNYFKIFYFKESFTIDYNILEENYLSMQQQIHPDNFQQKTALELNLALQHTSLINEAYLQLKSPLKRSEYLLKLQNIIVNQDNKSSISPQQDLLNYIFNIRNEIEDINNKDELKTISININKDIEKIIQEIAILFPQEQYELIAKLTIKLRYLEKIHEEIDLKLAI
jgi:molecular chaperone HscB